MIKKILILIIIFFPLSNLYSEWRLVDSLHWTRGSQSIDCADKMNCMVVSSSGAGSWSWVRKTTDGGNTWDLIFADTIKMEDTNPWLFNGMSQLSYVTPSFAVTANCYGEITITRDGGETWEAQYFNTTSIFWTSISFYDSLNGVVNSYGELFITNDGGITWRDTSLSHLQIMEIQMIDPQTIYGVGGTSFIKTADGGKTWDISTIKIENYPTFMRSPRSIFFLDRNIGWLAGYTMPSGSPPSYTQAISHTNDGGKTWEVQLDTTENNWGLYHIYFANELDGIAWGDLAQIWRTSDGGKNWIRGPESVTNLTKYDLPIFKGSISDMAFPEGHTRKIIAGQYVSSDLWLYDEVVSVKEYNKQKLNISLFPNPATEYITITKPSEGFEPSEGSDIKIFNTLGECVKNLTPTLSEGKGVRIDISHLPRGVYYIRIGNRTQMFVKV
jgi:photosystem II stability/assembly factor-like uncharacterized protein